MSTLRTMLINEEFDWKTGKIILHEITDECYAPGWACYQTDIKGAIIIKETDQILDHNFDGGYGAPRCPRFVAEDKEKIYFPVQYDGASWVTSIYKDIDKYLNIENETPYPGG